jgi:membrane protein
MSARALPGQARRFVDILKQSGVEWWGDNALRLSAALAYYTVFSLAPVLVLATAVAGKALGDQAATGELTSQLQRLLGQEDAGAVTALVKDARHPSTRVPATVLSTLVLVVAATGVFAELKSALNQVWAATPPPTASWKAFLKDRILSFAMVLSVGFVLLVSLVLNAAIAMASKYFAVFLPVPPWALATGDTLASLTMTTLLFALIFKWLPDTKIAWRDVWMGSLVTAVLFTIGRWLIGLYLGRTSVASAFGASASLAAVLVWSYYSSMILFYGAEFTEVFARTAGSRRGSSPNVNEAVQPRARAFAA